MNDELPTTKLPFAAALVDEQWCTNVVITIDGRGYVTKIDSGGEVVGNQTTAGLVALPGMVNVHSHAFQRGFAGLSEYRTAEKDSFWTWRDQMYRYVRELNPDGVYSIAKQLYREMLQAGYTSVGEFHYVHNDPQGRPYDELAELAFAISRAASEVGIGLCLLPVLYQRGGFRNENLVEGQNRFRLSNQQFVDLVEACQKRVAESNRNRNGISNADQSVGIALHSLRAVDLEPALDVVNHFKAADRTIPIHIHVAEQTQEVEQCIEVHGMRPVEFLYEHFPVDQHWCLIHATHLNGNEIETIANSRAVVGLCPTTEANLGDGLFAAKQFLDRGGRISIGSDSHCSVDMREELRILEYGQRLVSRSRAVLGTETKSVGRRLYEEASRGGRQAIGLSNDPRETSTGIQIGERADFTLVDPHHASIGNESGDRLLDRLIFTNAGNPIAGVVIGGKVHLS